MLTQDQSIGQVLLLSSTTTTLCTLQLGTIGATSGVQRHGKRGPCSGIPHGDLLTARVETNASIHEQIWGSSHHSSTPKKADWKLIKNASALVNDRLLLLAVCIEGGGGTVPCPRCWRAPGGLSHCLAARLLPYQRRHINEVAVLFVQMLITTSTYLWMEGCWLHGGHLNRPLGKMLR